MKPDYTGEYVLNREASTPSPLGAQLRGTDHDQDNVWIFERS